MTNEERDDCLKRIDHATNTQVDALIAIHETLKGTRTLIGFQNTLLVAAGLSALVALAVNKGIL